MTSNEIATQLAELGVARDSVLVVHTAFSQVRPVDGGPEGLIDALLGAIGPAGTLVMPSMSDDDDHMFDARWTPCRGMGIVAETFWRRAGVVRSNSPHAFAALGRHAGLITSAHPDDVPHGLDSPIGRVYQLDGSVLLLGAGHEGNTMLHLAENMAGVRYRRLKHLTVSSDDRLPRRVEYAEIDHCCERFGLMDEWLDAEGVQRRGTVGGGHARLVRAHDIIAVALQHLREDELVFLHPRGACAECDDARSGVPTSAGRS